MVSALKGKFDLKIDEFNKQFPLEWVIKLNPEEAVDHFFGCCEDSFDILHEDTLIYHLKKGFRIIDHEDLKIETTTTLGLTYIEKKDKYMHLESKSLLGKKMKEYDLSDAKEEARIVQKILKDYSYIVEEIDYYETEKIKMPENVQELCKNKIKNTKQYLTYGIKKLLAIYFPKMFLPFASNKDIDTFFDEYEVAQTKDELMRILLLKHYCIRNSLSTYDIAFEFYNYAIHRKFVLNFGESYSSERELREVLSNGELSIKLTQIKNSFPNFRLIDYSQGREVYISYKDKVLYKSILEKAKIESNKSLVVRFINLVDVNEKYNRTNNNLIEYIKTNFISDYQSLFGNNKKLEELFNIIRISKPIKRFTIVKGKTQCHTLNHIQNLVDVNILVIDKSDIDVHKVKASYCNNCDRFTIHIEDFRKLEHECFAEYIVADIKNESREPIDFGAQYSYLYHIGYNVSQRSDIPQDTRRKYLDYMLDYEWSREKLMSHIRNEIDKRKNLPNMSRAISIWEKDLEYVRNRGINKVPNPHFYVHYAER